jgi:hypothetical protein
VIPNAVGSTTSERRYQFLCSYTGVNKSAELSKLELEVWITGIGLHLYTWQS